MQNWRKPSKSPDRLDNLLNPRPSPSNRRRTYAQRYQTPTSESPENLTPPLTSQNQGMRYFGENRERRDTFSELGDLIELNHKNSTEIILKLTKKCNSFSQLLISHLKPDWIVLIIAILSKVCSSCFRTTKVDVLKAAISEKFLQTLEKYVRTLKDQMGENRNNPEEFLVNLLFVCESFIDLIPTDYWDTLHGLLKVIEPIPCLREGTNIEGRQKTNKILMEKLNVCKEHQEAQIGTLSVYPTKEEILTSNFGLKSKYFVEGKYENVKVYLDIQVKLLRESFAAALQPDIAQCIEHAQSPNRHIKYPAIGVYPDVVFGLMVVHSKYWQTGVTVQFSNWKHYDDIFLPSSSRLKDGSVVCFTKDNFRTIFLGSVSNIDYEQDQLIISFEPEHYNFDVNVSYTMVEVSVYLHPYYDILEALSCMSENDFPLKTYLIDAAATVESPGYLNSTSSIHLAQGSRVNVFENNWPSADELKLDSSQYSAFKAALTQKFVMIQGAPGTGKTYLGLQIVKTFLHKDNQKLWYNDTPILVVCSSKYVLDQFLEGLISSTNRIISLGHCKSDKLKNFTLKSARTRGYADRNVPFQWSTKMTELKEQLSKYHKFMKHINNFNNIINFLNFESIDENIETSWFLRASKADLLAWLFDEQSQDLYSIEISEILKDIAEEEKNFGSVEDNAIFDDQRNILDEPSRIIIWSKSHTWKQIVKIRNALQEMESVTSNQSDKLRELETQLKDLWQNYQCFKMKMSHRGSAQTVSKPINVDYQSPQSMDPNDRWNLYFYWINLYKDFVEKKFVELHYEHRELSHKITEFQNMLDLEVMKGALILGMTFSVAVRLHATLQSLKCRIVVVEEACKVSEAHIVVSLTKHCENLILLDNHSELCRATSRANISLGINIMERMMRNGMQCHVLSIQHRIRPEIVELLVPFNFPKLENHHPVTKFPPVLGLPLCKYFIHHEHVELCNDLGITNLYEATFLVNLAVYLRQVGYQAEDMTVIAANWAQMEVLYEESKRHGDLLKSVQMCTFDNYLSRECKIVLLSLVRNNTEGKIGRLGSEDVVIFALSRAKEGLYIMGNIDLLSENSQPWRSIKEVLVKQNCVGNFLPVCCKVNPDHVTQIKEPKDFDEVGEKVCNKICGVLLNCGHRCSKICHILEEDHTATVCTELCSKRTQ